MQTKETVVEARKVLRDPVKREVARQIAVEGVGYYPGKELERSDQARIGKALTLKELSPDTAVAKLAVKLMGEREERSTDFGQRNYAVKRFSEPMGVRPPPREAYVAGRGHVKFRRRYVLDAEDWRSRGYDVRRRWEPFIIEQARRALRSAGVRSYAVEMLFETLKSEPAYYSRGVRVGSKAVCDREVVQVDGYGPTMFNGGPGFQITKPDGKRYFVRPRKLKRYAGV